MSYREQTISNIISITLFIISFILLISSILTLFELSGDFEFGRYSTIYGLIMLILGIGCIGAAISFALKGDLKILMFKPNISLRKSIITTIILFISIAMFKTGQIMYDRHLNERRSLSQTIQYKNPLQTYEPHISELERQYPGWGIFGSNRCELSLLSPGPLELVTPPLPDEEHKLIKEHTYMHESYIYKSGMITINLTWIYFNDSIEPNLKEAMDDTLLRLGNRAKLIKKEIKPVKISTLDGLIVDATYESNHGGGAFKGVVLSKDSRLWSVFINYPDNNNRIRNIAESIIYSIEFDDITGRGKHLLNLDSLKR